MDKITIRRGHDGFGSQMLSIISGIAYAKTNGIEYQHTKISGIKLVGVPLNIDLKLIDECNDFIDDIIKNLNLLPVSTGCKTFPFFHQHILKNGVENYYSDNFLNETKNSCNTIKPEIYNNDKFNIAIHIRRGDDILERDKYCRWVNNDVYEKLIINLLEKHKNVAIHIFSWNDPKLNVSDERIKYHITDDGSMFLEDFNSLIHADLLVVGSSTFSISAGFFNKNTVICDSTLCKLETPIPRMWLANYKKII